MFNKKVFKLIFVVAVIICGNTYAKNASIQVDTNNISDWVIDKGLYGRFFEHHGTDVYPGIYEQYIVNTSFEKYYHKAENSPTPRRDINPWLVFRDIKPTDGIAEPWEPFNMHAGCSYGWSIDSVNSQVSQKIVNTSKDSFAGVKQRLAICDYRCAEYNLRLYAKSIEGTKPIEVRLIDHESKEVFDTVKFNISPEWTVYTGLLNLKSQRATAKYANRHGIYELVICFKGPGQLLLDQITIFPNDAINGCWNPDTVTALKDTKVSVIRWPGGNFASGYHWQDGIGDIDKRPTRPNLAWEGLESNHVGTDEFLQFCEIAGLTPLVCVGFDYCTPAEAASWVEYCNGDITTKFGKIRAENGHPEPYDIKLWQVGNEVYGDYQIGHTTADDYATRYLDYYKAMKKADSTIKVMAMGKDPGYQEDDDNAWNKTLFKIIANDMDYIDIHRYVRGIRRKEELEKWDINRLAEVYISFSTQYEAVIDSIRQLAERKSLKVKLAVTEWAQYLSLNHLKLPGPFSHGNAIFYAGMMNAFIRNSDFVAISCSHDLSIFMGNKFGWNVPLTPRNDVAKMYAEADVDRVLKTKVDTDTFDMEHGVPQMFFTTGIPYIDAAAATTDNKNRIVLFIINRSVESDYDVDINFEGLDGTYNAEMLTFEAVDDPMVSKTWLRKNVSQTTAGKTVVENGRARITAKPLTLIRVTISK